MKIEKAKVMGILAKNLNLSGLMVDVLDEILEPVLKGFVADTSNPYDDMLLAAIYPVLEAELKLKLIEFLDGLFKEGEVVVSA
jgi:hypothetical protein